MTTSITGGGGGGGSGPPSLPLITGHASADQTVASGATGYYHINGQNHNTAGSSVFAVIANAGAGVPSFNVLQHGFYLAQFDATINAASAGRVTLGVNLSNLNGFLDKTSMDTDVALPGIDYTVSLFVLYSTDPTFGVDALTAYINNQTAGIVTLRSTSVFRLVRLGTEYA